MRQQTMLLFALPSVVAVSGRAVTLKNGARYFLDLETSEEEFGDLAGLSLNDFDIGKVRVLGKNFSEAEFVTGASSSC